METRTDIYGRTITLTILNDTEVYSTEGVVVSGPVGFGWERALSTLNAHAPASATVNE